MRNIYLIFVFVIFQESILMAQKSADLNTVTVNANRAVDTVFGTWKFSVSDYEFIEDKLVLLTFEKNLEHATLILTNASQKILSKFNLPDEAKEFYKDYMGNVNVICLNHIYQIDIKNDVINLKSMPINDFKNKIMPCIVTLNEDIYFSNYQRDYPEFTYYAYNTIDKKVTPFKTVCDQDLLKGYNMEYYFLTSRQRLDARKLADEYNVDFHRIAAAMSGLTRSMFYTPLYAPLFVMKDTVVVFDHYNDVILKYDKKQQCLDSIHIEYNHPKNWREWKHKIIVDKISNETYALYQKNGFYYLKRIDLNSGKIISSFKLSNQYVDKIKIKGGYVYYVYSPFESLQEFFLYKEVILSF